MRIRFALPVRSELSQSLLNLETISLHLPTQSTPLTFPRMQADFASERITPGAHLPKQHTECETKFVLSLSALREAIDLRELSHSRILQSYFASQHLGFLHDFAAQMLQLTRAETRKFHVSSARLRREVSEGGVEYSLQLKGPKTGEPGAKINRTELTIPVESAHYNRLLKAADRGQLIKTRFHLPGKINLSTGRILRCTAEIDLLQHAGYGEFSRSPLSHQFDFATVDLELPRSSFLNRIRQGQHSFGFLNELATELSECPKEIRNAFSTRRIAKDGFDSSAQRALKQLCKGR